MLVEDGEEVDEDEGDEFDELLRPRDEGFDRADVPDELPPDDGADIESLPMLPLLIEP